MRRGAVLAVLGLVLVVSAPSATAVPTVTFSAKTDNLPQPLVLGEWDETHTQLTVTGLAANGFTSSFESEWTSDTVKLGPNTALTLGGSVTLLQVLAGGLDRHLLFRLKLGNLKWSGWARIADFAQEVPNAAPGGATTLAALPLGKLFYRACKGCRVAMGVRYGGGHHGTTAFRETLALSFK